MYDVHLTDYPPILQSADQTSTLAQRSFVRATFARLACLLVAAACGLGSWKFDGGTLDWAGVTAAVGFFLAIVTEAYLLRARPDRVWYEARAAAESAKTLSWRFMVGGHPFDKKQSDVQAEELFVGQLGSVLQVLRGLELEVPSHAHPQISAEMRRRRNLSFAERRNAYEHGRVANQQRWYQEKAAYHSKRAKLWTAVLFAADAVGIAAALARATGIITIDLLGLIAAFAGSVAAWLQARQHQALANAYSVTALELPSIRTRIQHQQDEIAWAAFVSDAEDAFSREHTLWRASRGIFSVK